MNELSSAISEALRMVTVRGQAPTVAEIAREAVPGLTSSFGDSVNTIARQIDLLPVLTTKQADALLENTQALTQNTAVQRSGGTSIAGSVASTAMKALGGGLGLVPLVSSVLGLFRSDKTEEPPPLTTYAPQRAVKFVGAVPQQSGAPIQAIDYGQEGTPRTIASSARVWAPSITVQVKAMDSRSFLDHSDDIAQTVREAILNAHTLGDVMSEL